MIHPYDGKIDLEPTAEMISLNDEDNTFMPMATTPEEKFVLAHRLLAEPRDHFVLKEQGQVFGLVSIALRAAPSKRMAQELLDKGPGYKLCGEMLLSRRDLPDNDDGQVARVSIIVAKSQRRKGHGKRLMEFAERHINGTDIIDLEVLSEAQDAGAIEFDVSLHNVGAIVLYTSLGYQQVACSEKLGLVSFRKTINR